MRPLSDLRQDMEVGRSLGDIVDVLKTAALIQFRQFQESKGVNVDFLREAESAFVLLGEEARSHPYAFDRKSLPSAIVVLTSDEGFLGELNTLLIHAAVDMRQSERDEIIVMGERGARYLEDMNISYSFFPGVSDEARYTEAALIQRYVLRAYRERVGRVHVIYPEFVSLTAQRVRTEQLLPAPLGAPASPEWEPVLFEPSIQQAFAALVEAWFGYMLFHMFRSAKLAEFAARIMHLEGSTHELGGMNRELTQEYFRQMRSLKDKVIREISASKMLLEARKSG